MKFLKGKPHIRKDCKYLNLEKWCKKYGRFADRNYICQECDKYEKADKE